MTIMFYEMTLFGAGPYGSFVPVVTRNSELLGSNPGRGIIWHQGYAYTVLQTAQRPDVCSAVYGTVQYKYPWSLLKRVGHSPDFGLPSVAILPWLRRKRRKAIFTHSLCSTHWLWSTLFWKYTIIIMIYQFICESNRFERRDISNFVNYLA